MWLILFSNGNQTISLLPTVQGQSQQMFIDVYYNATTLSLILHIDNFSVIASFETVISTYAQQLSMNEIQNFTTPSLTLVTELVSNWPWLTKVFGIQIMF
jgi:hypothetical protein